MDNLMRDKFIELVHDLLWDDEDPQRANMIIDCADEYAESMKSQWIPASERLPEVGQAVVVTTKDGLLGFGKCFDAGHLAWYYHDIIAWTPFLLKPYQEVNKNDIYTTFN